MTRTRLALACIIAASGVAPAGAYLAWGTGIGLVVLGGMLFALGVLLGWEA